MISSKNYIQVLSTKTEAGDIASQAKENGKHPPVNFARHDEAMNKYYSTYCFVTLQFVTACTYIFV